MIKNPENYRYTASHEWAKKEADGTITVGITHQAQELLGELVFVSLPNLQKEVTQAQETAVVESVKAASDVYAPLAGKIVAVNEALNQQPEQVNQDCYQTGWIFKLQPLNPYDFDKLLSAKEYQQGLS